MSYARAVKTWWKRLLISLAIALFLPLPNPHVDEYVPLIRAVVIDPTFGTLGFWVILLIVLGVYVGVVFGILTILSRLLSRRATTGK